MTVTAAKVVDASAVAALIFAEREADEIAAAIRDHHRLAPALLEFELANVCWKKCRRDPGHRAALTRAFGLFGRLDIEVVSVDRDAVLALALETGLTAYDATYLWLSREHVAELVTLDRKLALLAARTTP
jgi:predicted nucleic acid-binding protein